MAKGKLILDRYRLLGEAGAGGYGTVMVARDPRIQRKVAIKAIPLTESDALRAALPGADAVAGLVGAASYEGDTGYTGDTGYAERAAGAGDAADDVSSLAHIPGLDEARTAALLSDPHIVTVYDVEVRDRTAYLVMEYIEGITLSKLLRDYANSLTLDMVTAVFDAVANALKKAHARRVLHLDIKPDNILIDRDGLVKVTDFGLATLVDASGVGSAGGGTIGYMPLEQMRREELDMRTDEWALASVTYEMLTGENPFLADDLQQAQRAVEEAELVLPSLCWEGLDPGIDDVLFYALAPNKEDRYAMVLDFQEEADRFLGDAAIGQQQLKEVVTEALDAARASQAAADAAGAGLADALGNEGDTVAPDGAGGSYNKGEGGRFGNAFGNKNNQGQQGGGQGAARVRAPRTPMSARLTPQVQKALSRIFGALASGLLCFLALSNMPFFAGWTRGTSAATVALSQATSGAFAMQPLPLMLIVSLVFAVVGAIVPHVGALIGFCAMSLAFIMGSNPLMGILLLAASIAWWFFVARDGVAEPNVAMALPIVGAVGFNAFLPLAAGTCLRPRNAFITLGFSALWALALGACGTGSMLGWDAFTNWGFADADMGTRLLGMITAPATWCIIASWLLAVVAESACNLRGNKPLAIFGVVLAAAILVAGALAATWFEAGMTTVAPSAWLLAPIVVSAVIMLAVVGWLRD